MKSIKSLVKWILFVPVCLMSVALTVICGLFPDTAADYLTTDANGIAEIIAFSVLGLFVVCFVLSLFDKMTSPVHMLKKNFFCGAAAFVSAFGLAATAALDITTSIQSGSVEFMTVLTAVFTALSGVAMLFIGLNHFSGNNTPGGISVFYLMLPLWCGVHLIDRFLKHTAMPVDAADTLDLIMFVALAMFFINSMMVHAIIPGKNAVKSAITFGFPATVISFVYGISLVLSAYNSGSSFVDYIPGITYAVLGLYAIGFTAELSFMSKTVEEQMIVETPELSFMSKTVEEQMIVETVSFDEEAQDASAEDDEAEDASAPVPVPAEPVAYEEDTAELSDDNSQEELPVEESADNYDDIEVFEATAPAAVRVAQEDDDTDDVWPVADIPVHLPEDTPEDTSHSDIAEELFRVAQERDLQSVADLAETEPTIGSEEKMIIDGEESAVTPVASVKPAGSTSRPKGPTTREAVMYEDEDFILAIDGSDLSVDETQKEREDISSFILEEKEDTDTSGSFVEKTYADRLDEIDQLIISIQGGDSASVDED